jgi:hypothetical protein
MWTHLFKHIDILPSNVNLLDGNAPDLKRECEEYEEKIKAVGGVELFLGGIGTDGHIAFNEPGSSLQSRTRVKTLAYETIVANARFFNSQLELVPKMALTVGVATIMDAREVLLIITGHAKAAALERCVEQGVNHMFTLSAIQMHPCACIVCDDDATGELRVRTVRYFKGLEKVHIMIITHVTSSSSCSCSSSRSPPAVLCVQVHMELIGHRDFHGVQSQQHLVRKESEATKPPTQPTPPTPHTDEHPSTQLHTTVAQLKAELTDKSTDG